MFIVEQPYASPLIFKSLERLQEPVLLNQAVQEFNIENRRLNLLSDEAFVEYYRKIPEPLLYCNSENGLRWIADNLSETPFAKRIELFKNKTRFRRAISKIYPDFYFREVGLDELQTVEYRELPKKFVVKPSIGFLSLGVRFISSQKDWETARREIARESSAAKSAFPSSVVDLSRYLIEEAIDGEEIAVDAYFAADGSPVVLDVFQHPFVDANDVRDRVYQTSKKLVRRLLPTIETTLKKIGDATETTSFPFHFEFRIDAAGNAVPIEINPGRFAGWHTTELALYAYGVDVYECFTRQERPNWNRILADSDADATTNFFAIFEAPAGIDVAQISRFDLDALSERFSKLFELRPIDFRTRPIFAIAFAQTNDSDEIRRFLELNVAEFAVRRE